MFHEIKINSKLFCVLTDIYYLCSINIKKRVYEEYIQSDNDVHVRPHDGIELNEL